MFATSSGSYSRTIDTTIERLGFVQTEELEEERSVTSYSSAISVLDGEPAVRQWSEGDLPFSPQIPLDALIPVEDDYLRWQRASKDDGVGTSSIADGIERKLESLTALRDTLARDRGYLINFKWERVRRTSRIRDSLFWGVSGEAEQVQQEDLLSIFEQNTNSFMSMTCGEDAGDLLPEVVASIEKKDATLRERRPSGPCLWSPCAAEKLSVILRTALQNAHINNHELFAVSKIGHRVLPINITVRTKGRPHHVVDDEGVLYRTRDVVRNGVLRNCLLSLRRSFELDTCTAGGGRLDWLGEISHDDLRIDIRPEGRAHCAATSQLNRVIDVAIMKIDFESLVIHADVFYERDEDAYLHRGTIDLKEMFECLRGDIRKGLEVLWTEDARFIC